MQAPYLTGQLLLALPGMSDPRFDNAVIAMSMHDEEGALGVGIGHVLKAIRLHELLKSFDIEPGDAPDAPLHWGGPVEPGRGFVLHGRDWGGEDTVDVAGAWSLTGTLDVLKAIAAGKGPSRWIVALGYAGWGAGQLDGELAGAGWLPVPASDAVLFDLPAELRWAAALNASGIDPRLLSPLSGTA